MAFSKDTYIDVERTVLGNCVAIDQEEIRGI